MYRHTKTVSLQVTIGTEGVPVHAATWKNGRVGVIPFEHPTGKAQRQKAGCVVPEALGRRWGGNYLLFIQTDFHFW